MVETPALKPKIWVGLTVSDLERSVAWYQRLFGFELEPQSSWGTNTALFRHVASGVQIGLIAHESAGRFTEFNCGLDHLEFMVPDADSLAAWVARLDELGIEHSDIKHGRIVTFRDPDNIQLEFFLEA